MSSSPDTTTTTTTTTTMEVQAETQAQAQPVEKTQTKTKTKTKTDQRKTLFLLLLPKIPLMARVALLHILRVSLPSRYVDLRTELIVAVMRSFLAPSPSRAPWIRIGTQTRPPTITSLQRLSMRDPGVRGRIWVSRYTVPAPPEPGVQDAIAQAIEALWDPETKAKLARDERRSTAYYTLPDLAPVEAEWAGHRADVEADALLPDISEADKYAALTRECANPRTTVLYFHGGAYWLLDPATHRPTARRLARLTGGRCFSVRYRLAPQHPFPAALADALTAYLALLYPPPGAFHDPVAPGDIVFAGDSAGGNLCLVLLQTILTLHRLHKTTTPTIPTIQWHNRPVELPLPAGVAVVSPWMDLTHSLPSCSANAAYDYLPTPAAQSRTLNHYHPPCAAWPATPPRAHMYAPDAMLDHPLATPLLVPGGGWRGSCPVYVCTGWELLADEDKYAAARLWGNDDGAEAVVFEEYEGMPHCFGLVFPRLPVSERFFRAWADFVRDCVAAASGGGDEGEGGEEGEGVEGGAGGAGGAGGRGKRKVESRFTLVKASGKEVALDPKLLTPFSEEEIRERVRRRVEMMLAESRKVEGEGERGGSKL